MSKGLHSDTRFIRPLRAAKARCSRTENVLVEPLAGLQVNTLGGVHAGAYGMPSRSSIADLWRS